MIVIKNLIKKQISFRFGTEALNIKVTDYDPITN